MRRTRHPSELSSRQTPNHVTRNKRGFRRAVGAAATAATLAATVAAAGATQKGDTKGAAEMLVASVPDQTLRQKRPNGRPNHESIDQITLETALPSIVDTAQTITANGQIPEIVVRPKDLYIPKLKNKSPKSIVIKPTADSRQLAGSLNRQFAKFGMDGLHATTDNGYKEAAYRDTSFKDEFNIALGGVLTVKRTRLKAQAAWLHTRAGTLSEVTGDPGYDTGVKRLVSLEGDEQVYVIPRDPMPGETIPTIPELPQAPPPPVDPGPPIGQVI